MTRPANGVDGERWQLAWCDTCVHDINLLCPILTLAVSGVDPEEWHPGPMHSPETAVFCTAYVPRERT